MQSPFSYRTAGRGQIEITRQGRVVTMLRGAAAVKFVNRAEKLDEPALQQLMAATTGQYKFGNERAARSASKTKRS